MFAVPMGHTTGRKGRGWRILFNGIGSASFTDAERLLYGMRRMYGKLSCKPGIADFFAQTDDQEGCDGPRWWLISTPRNLVMSELRALQFPLSCGDRFSGIHPFST